MCYLLLSAPLPWCLSFSKELTWSGALRSIKVNIANNKSAFTWTAVFHLMTDNLLYKITDHMSSHILIQPSSGIQVSTTWLRPASSTADMGLLRMTHNMTVQSEYGSQIGTKHFLLHTSKLTRFLPGRCYNQTYHSPVTLAGLHLSSWLLICKQTVIINTCQVSFITPSMLQCSRQIPQL